MGSRRRIHTTEPGSAVVAAAQISSGPTLPLPLLLELVALVEPPVLAGEESDAADNEARDARAPVELPWKATSAGNSMGADVMTNFSVTASAVMAVVAPAAVIDAGATVTVIAMVVPAGRGGGGAPPPVYPSASVPVAALDMVTV